MSFSSLLYDLTARRRNHSTIFSFHVLVCLPKQEDMSSSAGSTKTLSSSLLSVSADPCDVAMETYSSCVKHQKRGLSLHDGECEVEKDAYRKCVREQTKLIKEAKQSKQYKN